MTYVLVIMSIIYARSDAALISMAQFQTKQLCIEAGEMVAREALHTRYLCVQSSLVKPPEKKP